ncbi:hypothetical protein [Streptomyces sp. NPDC050504]|uniref:phage fiber-tail adaptor protein n=1 Tax=Streptomyces sp. NPDC050504 TaxID=3365618 RepID=UPI0037BDC68F
MADRFTKDPQARLDYSWDWTDWLGASDTVASATVTVPAGLTAVGAPVVADAVVTQRVSGGVLGEVYTLVCQVTTVGGLIDERSIRLTIGDR